MKPPQVRRIFEFFASPYASSSTLDRYNITRKYINFYLGTRVIETEFDRLKTVRSPLTIEDFRKIGRQIEFHGRLIQRVHLVVRSAVEAGYVRDVSGAATVPPDVLWLRAIAWRCQDVLTSAPIHPFQRRSLTAQHFQTYHSHNCVFRSNLRSLFLRRFKPFHDYFLFLIEFRQSSIAIFNEPWYFRYRDKLLHDTINTVLLGFVPLVYEIVFLLDLIFSCIRSTSTR